MYEFFQAVGKIPIDVEKLRVDYLAIVGHKVSIWKFWTDP